jgi:hypothetical protein
VINLPDLVRIGPDATLLVCFDSCVLPATLQQLVHHIQELVRNLIPFVVLDALLESIGLRGTLQIASNYIPPYAAIRNVVKGSKLPRERIRVFVGRGGCDSERDIPGGMRHSRDKQADVKDWDLGS